MPGEIFVTDHAIFRDNWPSTDFQPGVCKMLSAGEEVQLVNEQLARVTASSGWDRVDLGRRAMRDIPWLIPTTATARFFETRGRSPGPAWSANSACA
jgi:hypothetical protein